MKNPYTFLCRHTAVLCATTVTAALLWSVRLEACTGFYAQAKGRVLAGNNEDGCNPVTKVWFVPQETGKYGRMYVGYDDLSPQGGVNEKGLWFDAFGLPRKEIQASAGEIYPGDLQDKLMAECATVADVLKLLKRYSRAPMTRYQWIFGDRTGASVVIEGDAILPMQGQYHVITNFRQSEHPGGEGYECGRYQIANAMLKARPEVSVGNFRHILAATHSEGSDATLYSYIADLKRGLVYLYHFHNFENVVVLDVRKELAKGRHVYHLPELFPKTDAAEGFAYRAHAELAARKAARLCASFDAKTFPDYSGRYVIAAPEILARQTITISTGPNQLFLQLNDGGKWEVLPDSPASFFLLSYGGLEFSCHFARDGMGRVDTLFMEGCGLNIKACRVD
ncbi:MAG TPA: hypothetical protein VEC99_06180 [Clostridia bacterium]|nr:hypothetical protein [Clostridia bacterium]